MGSGRCRSLPVLLVVPVLVLLVLLVPAACGDCGQLPQIPGAEPPEDSKDKQSFPVGSKITYQCVQGFTKVPLKSDTIQCLENALWSVLPEFCNRSCHSPPRVSFARVSQEDEFKNFYAVGITVNYVCSPGYTNTTDELPTSTCREDLTWSEVPMLCEKKSCGTPENPEHGTVVTTDHLFGTKADVICDDGYMLTAGQTFILCYLKGDGVAWTQLPTCQLIQASSSTVGTTAVTDATKPLEEKASEYRYILPLIIIPCVIGVVVILIWSIKKCGVKQKGTYKPNPTNAGDEEQGPSCQERKTGP